MFEKPVDGWRNTTEWARLTAADGGADDFFGQSVGIYDDTIVVGAPFHVTNYGGQITAPGQVYVYTRPVVAGWQNTDQPKAKLKGSGPAARPLGTSVSIWDDTIVAGAPLYSDSKGAVYVYVRPGVWEDGREKAILEVGGALADDQLGASVSVTRDAGIACDLGPCDVVVAGAPRASSVAGSRAGAAFVFVEPTSGWRNITVPTAKLFYSGAQSGDGLGRSVSIEKGRVAVGAPTYGSPQVPNQGRAFFYFRLADNWATMQEVYELKPQPVTVGDRFGASVAISRTSVVVGAPTDDFDDVNSPRPVDCGSTNVFDIARGTVDVEAVPTLSGWGALITILLMIGSFKLYFGRDFAPRP